MRRFVFILLLSLMAFSAFTKGGDTLCLKKRMVRYNPLGTIVWKSVPMYYEHRLNKVVGFSLGAGWIIPHRIRTSALSFQSDWLNGTFYDGRVTGYFFTPEFKFYLRGQGPKGFYISRYIRYLNYNVAFDAVFDDGNGNKARMDMSLTLNEYGTGRQYGYQWVLGENIVLDFFFIGVRTSEYTIKFRGDAAIRSEDWEKLQNEFLAEYEAWVEDAQIGFIMDRLPWQFSERSLKFSYPFTLGNIRHGISVGFRF